MFWNWFTKSKLVNIASLDNFRIKVITLQDGSKKYYPQYKGGTLTSEWLCAVVTRDNNVILVDISQFDLVHSIYYCELSEEDANTTIERLKAQFQLERAEEFLSEEIIKK